MPLINKLEIQYLRNIKKISLSPNKDYNLFFGNNGSGKSSLLEAIGLISTGKSFRSHLKSRIITHGCEQMMLFASIVSNDGNQHKLGFTKIADGKARLRIDGQYSRNLAAATKLLPLVLIDPNSYALIERGPQQRRHYLDWGLFHVEPSFGQIFNDFQTCLKQRNAALKAQAGRIICQTWDAELVTTAEKITRLRKNYFHQLEPHFKHILAELALNLPIQSCYEQGWPEEMSLQEALEKSFAKDLALGCTSLGPQKADVSYLINRVQANDVLSRGQMKLTVSAMQFAQGRLYRKLTGNHCIYLIDDLTSELDIVNRIKLFNLLAFIPGQFFITATSKDVFADLDTNNATMFHVEHGEIHTLLR